MNGQAKSINTTTSTSTTSNNSNSNKRMAPTGGNKEDASKQDNGVGGYNGTNGSSNGGGGPSSMKLTSDEVNFLVYRYLQEAGFVHTAFTFINESMLSRTNVSKTDVPPGALISFLQKGLQYVGIEEAIRHDVSMNGRQKTKGKTGSKASSTVTGSGVSNYNNSNANTNTEHMNVNNEIIDFSLLSPHAIKALIRRDPSIKLNVSPGLAGAIRAKIDADAKTKKSMLGNSNSSSSRQSQLQLQQMQMNMQMNTSRNNAKSITASSSAAVAAIANAAPITPASQTHTQQLQQQQQQQQQQSEFYQNVMELKGARLPQQQQTGSAATTTPPPPSSSTSPIPHSYQQSQLSQNTMTHQQTAQIMAAMDQQGFDRSMALRVAEAAAAATASGKNTSKFNHRNKGDSQLSADAAAAARAKAAAAQALASIQQHDTSMSMEVDSFGRRSNSTPTVNNREFNSGYGGGNHMDPSSLSSGLPPPSSGKLSRQQEQQEVIKNSASTSSAAAAVVVSQQQVHKMEEEDKITRARQEEVLELNKHTSEVFMCAWNPIFTELLATGSGDASARIWEMGGRNARKGSGSCKLLQHGTNSSDKKNKDVTTLEWSSDGELLATGSYDGVARVWRKDGSLVHVLQGHLGPIFSLKWNKKGNFLLSGSYDKTTIVWNVSGDMGSIKQQFNHHSAPALDVDWKDDLTFASCSTDKSVFICRVGSPGPLQQFTGHKDEVNAVKWDPSGTLLASCSDDYTAKVWSLGSKSNQPLHDFKSHKQEIYTVKWSPTGPGSKNPHKPLMLATASFDATVRLWNIKDGSCISVLSRHRDSVYSVSFSPSGDYLASGSLAGQLYIWRVRDGQNVKNFKGKGDIFEVAWNVEESRVAACFSSNVVNVIDFNSK